MGPLTSVAKPVLGRPTGDGEQRQLRPVPRGAGDRRMVQTQIRSSGRPPAPESSGPCHRCADRATVWARPVHTLPRGQLHASRENTMSLPPRTLPSPGNEAMCLQLLFLQNWHIPC